MSPAELWYDQRGKISIYVFLSPGNIPCNEQEILPSADALSVITAGYVLVRILPVRGPYLEQSEPTMGPKTMYSPTFTHRFCCHCYCSPVPGVCSTVQYSKSYTRYTPTVQLGSQRNSSPKQVASFCTSHMFHMQVPRYTHAKSPHERMLGTSRK